MSEGKIISQFRTMNAVARRTNANGIFSVTGAPRRCRRRRSHSANGCKDIHTAAEEHKESGGPPASAKLWFERILINVGWINSEATGHPTAEHTRTFYTEERFEDYILENPTPRTLHGLLLKGVILFWHVYVW